jgi:acetyl esterase/lipase
MALARQGYLVLNINHRLASDAPHPAQAQNMAAAVR